MEFCFGFMARRVSFGEMVEKFFTRGIFFVPDFVGNVNVTFLTHDIHSCDEKYTDFIHFLYEDW